MLHIVTDPKIARGWVKACGERSPVLAEVELHVFRGATLFVEGDVDAPISLNVTRFGKRKKNAWEPYANWYTAYTVERFRRQGYAITLARHVQRAAREAGCRRLKALAGTRLGLLLHVALGDQLWGVTDLVEVVVDTPLVHAPVYRGKSPPNAVEGAGVEPWSLERVMSEVGDRKLRYDAIAAGKRKNPGG